MSDKVIINEFLAFCQNKIDIMDELSIVQICASNFTDEEVEGGKSNLFSILSSEGVKLIQRKGEDKRKKNIRDVLKVLHEIKPELQPTYVAKDLNRLPPVSFDHVDVTRLLKDILILKSELQQLREESITKPELDNFKISIVTEVCARIGPSYSARKQPVQPRSKVENPEQAMKRSNADKNGCEVPTSPPATTRRKRSDSLDTIVSPPAPRRAPSYREIAIREPHSQRSNSNPIHTSGKAVVLRDNDGFTLVENNRKKRQLRSTNKCGTATEPSKLKAALLPEAIYLSRLETTCTVAHVKEHIESKGAQAIDIQILPQKKELDFRSFKIIINKQSLDTFLSTDFWPENLVFRKFRERLSKVNKAS